MDEHKLDYALKPDAQALLAELSSLDKDLENVGGARPRLDEHLAQLTDKVSRLGEEICVIEVDLNAAVLAEEMAAAREDANTQAAKTQGRVSFYLESLTPSNTISTLKLKVERLQAKLDQLIQQTGSDDEALVEEPWMDPPALVPKDWPSWGS